MEFEKAWLSYRRNPQLASALEEKFNSQQFPGDDSKKCSAGIANSSAGNPGMFYDRNSVPERSRSFVASG